MSKPYWYSFRLIEPTARREGVTGFDFNSVGWCLPLGNQGNDGMVEKEIFFFFNGLPVVVGSKSVFNY
jgi:hypothetical protein